MVKNAAWITPSGKWKFTIERSGRRCAPNCGPTNPWRPITKELNEFLERGNFWGSLSNYRTVSLQASRRSLFAITRTVPSAARSPFSRGSGYGSRRPPLGARANGGIIFGFPWLRRTRFRRFIDDRESHAAHAGWASRKPNASSIFVKTSTRLIAHDIAGATPHPSCSSEYGIRS
jgi:hypothetical protein